MIKKVLIVLFVTLMGLTACSTSTSPAPQPSETRTYEPPAMTDEELFIENIRQYDDNSIIAYATDADLLELGWSVCDVLDYYYIDDVVLEIINSADLSTDEDYEFVGIILVVSVVELCPQHLAEVEAYLNS